MQNTIRPLEIVHLAKSKGISLFVDNGQLALRKDKDTPLPKSLGNLIKENKEEIIDFLKIELSDASNATLINIKKVQESESYHVSNAQRRIWFASQLESGSIANNIPNTVIFDNQLDKQCLEKAINSVINRHEILRTVFKFDDNGELRQFVIPFEEFEFNIKYINLSNEKNANEICEEAIEKDSLTAFDLENGPLLRVCVFQLPNDRCKFYYNMHHIISDEWSAKILVDEVISYFKHYLLKTPIDLPELKIQYRDYSAWEVNQVNSGLFKDHESYWLSKLEGNIPVFNLPTNKARPLIKTYNGFSISTHLSAESISKLRDLTSSINGSLFTGLLTVWNVLLYRYTGETDLIMGCPIEGRDHPDLENQIGCYINALTLRNNLNPNSTFGDFLKQVNNDTLEAYKHQVYPFNKLVEKLDLVRDPSRSPLFDTIINFHGITNKLINGNDETLYIIGNEDLKFDLELHIMEISGDVGGGVDMMVGFNLDVYQREMIENLITHFRLLLNALINSPNESIGKIDFLTKEERSDLLREGQLNLPKEKSVLDLFCEQVKETPNDIAVSFGDENLTYKELDEQSNQFANCLSLEYKITNNSFVAVHLNKSDKFIVCVLGILKAGGVYVPIDTKYPSVRKEYIVQDANIDLLITNTEYVSEIDFYDGDFIDIDKKEFSHNINYDYSTESTDLAYVIYTSGSTGNPKGVMIENHSLVNYIDWCKKYYFNSKFDNCNFGLFTSPSFDLTITSIFLPLVCGGRLKVYNDELDALTILEDYLNSNLSCIKLTPAHINLLSETNIKDIHLEMAIVGGEELKQVHVDILRKLNPEIEIFNEYGPTEATVGCIVYSVGKNGEPIYIGKPIQNTEIYLCDKFEQLVPNMVLGEIYIGGEGLARGYLNQPELTNKKFINHPFKEGKRLYKTGDLGRRLESGDIEFKGRIDNQVKLNGYRIELEEIEFVLNQLGNIKQSVVLVKEDNTGKKQLIAYVVSKELVDARSIKEGLTLVLEEELPEYMLPNSYVVLDEIPLTNNGKIDRNALPVPDEEIFKFVEYVAPSNENEFFLVEVWEQILKRTKIGVNDNFYNLGGDSIKSIQLINLLKKKGYLLAVRDAIKNPVLKDMAKIIVLESNNNEDTFVNSNEELCLAKSVDIDDELMLNNVSENQNYFIKRPDAYIPSPTIAIPFISEIDFEEKLRNLLSLYPCFLNEFVSDAEKTVVYQKKISAEDLKLDLKFIKDFALEDQKKIEDEAQVFITQPFNYFDDTPLIRVYIVIDPLESDKAYLQLSIAHALADIETVQRMYQNLERNLDDPQKPQGSTSNLAFTSWQQSFLKSNQGLMERSWWSDYLKPIASKNHKKAEALEIEYVVQKSFFLGPQFEELQAIGKSLNVPLSVLLLASHNRLLIDLGFDSHCQLIAVNGRDENYEGLDITKVLGLTTNFLPMLIDKFIPQKDEKFVYDIYEQYLKIRSNHKIPYEIMRKDLKEQTGTDLDMTIKGYFNYRTQVEVSLDQNAQDSGVLMNTEVLHWNNIYEAGLICDQYKNGMSLRLLFTKELYEKMQYDLSLNLFIEKYIKGLSSLVN